MFILYFMLIFLTYISSTQSQCLINVNTQNGDLSAFSPLLLKPEPWIAYGNEAFYLPTENHEIMFDSDQQLLLHCPGSSIRVQHQHFDSGFLEITCRIHRTFRLSNTGESVSIRDVTCSRPPKSTVRRTNRRCTASFELLEIGFHLNNGIWLNQISVCFDSNCKRTLWAQSNITSRIDGYSQGVGRTNFIEGGSFFNIGVEVERCYYIPNQRVNINRQLNLAPNSVAIIDKFDKIFTRGHLAPKGDFVYGAQQLATFYFVNAAPQWASLNNKNWNELEISVRNYASSRRRNLVIFTGTHGHALLNGVLAFLHMDDSAGHIPIPLYFWKIVYDPEEEAGVAFIGLNNPYENDLTPFCPNICDQLRWPLSWERDIKELGFCFCCSIKEFRQFVQFPALKVKRLLDN